MSYPIRIVLSKTSHPGNIGGVARAMKNMALSELVLVSPKSFPSQQATDRASGADEILDNAKIVTTLEAAVSDCQWVYGTSGRVRSFPWPQLTPKAAAEDLVQKVNQANKVAVVFGNEQSGLSNEELQLCHAHIAIPANPDFASLNIACAVQIIAYEIYVQQTQGMLKMPFPEEARASHGAVQGLLEHWIAVAEQVGFLDPAHPKKFIPRLQKLFNKSQLTPEEVHLLRGFLKAVSQKELV